MKDHVVRLPVPPQTPSTRDTPRTKQLKELREKRLAFLASQNQQDLPASQNRSEIHKDKDKWDTSHGREIGNVSTADSANTQSKSNPYDSHSVLEAMRQDTRVANQSSLRIQRDCHEYRNGASVQSPPCDFQGLTMGDLLIDKQPRSSQHRALGGSVAIDITKDAHEFLISIPDCTSPAESGRCSPVESGRFCPTETGHCSPAESDDAPEASLPAVAVAGDNMTIIRSNNGESEWTHADAGTSTGSWNRRTEARSNGEECDKSAIAYISLPASLKQREVKDDDVASSMTSVSDLDTSFSTTLVSQKFDATGRGLTTEKEGNTLMISAKTNIVSDALPESVSSLNHDHFNADNLQSILGGERFRRLMQNFQESDDFESDVDSPSMVATRDFLPMKNREPEDDVNSNGISLNDVNELTSRENDLGLKTHRPYDDTVTLPSTATELQRSRPQSPASQHRNYVQLPRESVTCTYSVDQIYAQAESMSHKGNMEYAVFPRPPCQEYDLTQTSVRDSWVSSLSGVDDSSTCVSEASSSLTGREVRLLRQAPFGPIPQPVLQTKASSIAPQSVEYGGTTEKKKTDKKISRIDTNKTRNIGSTRKKTNKGTRSPRNITSRRKNSKSDSSSSDKAHSDGRPADPVASGDKAFSGGSRRDVAEDGGDPLDLYFGSVEDICLSTLDFESVHEAEIHDSPGRGLKIEGVSKMPPYQQPRASCVSEKGKKQIALAGDSKKNGLDSINVAECDISDELNISSLDSDEVGGGTHELCDEEGISRSIVVCTRDLYHQSRHDFSRKNTAPSPRLSSTSRDRMVSGSGDHADAIRNPAACRDAREDELNGDARPSVDKSDWQWNTPSAAGDQLSLTERLHNLGVHIPTLDSPKTHGVSHEGGECPRRGASEYEKSHCGLPAPAKSSGVPRSSMQEQKKQNLDEKVKVCPECAGINRPYMDWCTECGEVLVGIEPVPSRMKAKERQLVQTWKNEEARFEGVQHGAGDTSSAEYHNHASPRETPSHGFLTVPDGDNVRLSVETTASEVRDSDTFIYESNKATRGSLPVHLKSEFSLNLRSSSSTTASIDNTEPMKSPSFKNKKGKSKFHKHSKHKKGPQLGEDILFEYQKSSRKLLPRELRAELSLNLRDYVDSQPSTSAKPTQVNGECLVPVEESMKVDEPATDKKENRGTGTMYLAGSDQPESSGDSPDDIENDVSTTNRMVPDHAAAHIEPDAEVSVVDSSYKDFIHRLMNDNRFRPMKSQEISRPGSGSKPGPRRPHSGKSMRPKSAGNLRKSAGNRLQMSLEPSQQFPQRWATSSVAWGNLGGTSKSVALPRRPTSAHGSGTKDHATRARPSSAHGASRAAALPARPASAAPASRRSQDDDTLLDRQGAPTAGVAVPVGKQRPVSAGRLRPRGASGACGRSMDVNLHDNHRADVNGARESPPLPAEQRPPRVDRQILTVKGVPSSDPNSLHQRAAQLRSFQNMEEMGKYMSMAEGYVCRLYEKDDVTNLANRPASRAYLASQTIEVMSPRIQTGELSMMLCLPDEIMLYVFAFLHQADLMRCAQVSTNFRRIALDASLWRRISLKKKGISDTWLREIGQKQPVSLSLVQCRGDRVSANGMREFFRLCGDSLQELNVTGCTRGHLTGDNVILHASSRCRFITHLDVSWCNVNDNGVIAIAESSHRFESLCMNGCPSLTDEAIHAVVIKHGIYLRVLELFGCFNLTQRAITSISNSCKSLVTLNLGQCWKVTDSCIAQLSSSLGMVENLDLRGCKQLQDISIHHIVRNCPKLETLAVSNCAKLTDSALAEIASLSRQIRSLDLCGCRGISNNGVKAVARGCQYLEYLDLSSTNINHTSISALANYCNRRLEVLKINFCKHITLNCLIRLAKNANRLRKLYLYGLNGIRHANAIQEANPDLWIEM